MPSVSLANQTRFVMVLNLPHEVVPERASRMLVGTTDHDATTGERHLRATRKRISGSVTLQPKGVAGDVVRGLPMNVLRAPEVRRALQAWPPKLAAKTFEDAPASPPAAPARPAVPGARPPRPPRE